MAQGLPSSLDAAYEEAESTTFTIPKEVEDQLKKQAQETARRNKASEQALELSPIPQDMGGASAGTGNVPYLSAFTQAAQKYNVPINVLIGLAEQESRFKPTALGVQTEWGRAKGLMQYLDSTAAGMGINPYDPVQSIDAAARQLRQRLDKGYSMIDAAREHFAGPDRKKWGTKTHNYGIEVMQRAQKYQNIGAPAPSAQPAAQQQPQRSANPDPSRYRPLSADEVKRIEQAKKEGKSEIVLQIGMKPIKLGNQNADPLVTDKNKDANLFTDTGNLLLSGVNKLGESARELSHRIPITKPTAMLLDKINEYFVGKTSEQIFAEADKHYAGKMSAPTAKARQKLWVVEPGDKLDDGTTAKSWNIGPAWKDPRAYYAGIVESVPELAVSMGGSLSLARGAFNTAIKSGATREAASKAAAKTATLAGSFIEGGLGGASSAVEVRKKINELPDNVLQQSDVIKELMNGGMTLAQAKKEVAEKSATKAFVLAGVGTGVFGGLGDRAIAKIITEGSSSRIKSALSGAVAEGVFEEMPQSAAQQLAQNYAMQDADPNQRLMQGVANAAAGGAAIGGVMGGGIGAGTHRAPQEQQAGQPEQAAPPERKIGAIERAVNDGQDLDAAISAEIEAVTGQDNIEQLINQPNATTTDEGTSTATSEQWLGAPGTEVQVSPKEDPSSVYTVRVEGYQNGEVFARDSDGAPIQFGQDDIVSATPINDTEIPASSTGLDQSEKKWFKPKFRETVYEDDSGLMIAREAEKTTGERDWNFNVYRNREDFENEKHLGTAKSLEEAKALLQQARAPELTDFGVTPAETKAATQTDANLSSFEENTPQAAPDTPKAEPVEIESPEKTLAKMDEAELRARIKYLADQAKASGGWNKRLMEERRKVETQINNNQEQKIDDKPYFKWEGMSPAERMAAAEKAGIDANTARDISSKAWGAIDKSITDKLTAKPAPKPKAAKAPEVKQLEAKKPEADYSDAIPEQKQAATQEAAPFRQLIIDAHFNNPPMKAQLIQQEIKTGRPRHEVMKDVQGIVADIKAGKITAPAAQAAPSKPSIEGKDLGEGWSEFSKDSGTIGIPRADMPQIKAEHRGAMVNFMNARGIEHNEDTVAADSLKPTQKEFSKEKVKKASEREGGDRSILVSKDGHVLDGHHQWMAARENGEDVKVIRLDAPIKDLVDAAHEFPSSTVDDNTATPSQAETQTDERGPLLGADGKPKWFMSEDKAQAFIEKKKLTGQYEVKKVDNRRFEIHPIVADTQETTASNVAPTVAKTETAQPEATQTVTQWKEDMQEALAKADPDHPLFKKLQLSAKHGLKSENDRQVTLRQAREIEKQEQPAPKSQPSDFIQVISVSDKKAPTAQQIVEKVAQPDDGFTKVETKYGETLAVRTADLNDASAANLQSYSADGKQRLKKISRESIVADKAEVKADQFADNKLFTADKVAAARARLKSKLGQLNSGIDPEVLVDGMTIAGAYIESGVRKFSDYAKAMVEDLGDGVKPYLLSFWEGARNYPGLDNKGMTSVEDSAKEHAALLKPEDTQTEAVGQIAEKPKARTKKTGAKGDMVLTQDWGVSQIDGYGDGSRESGNDTKDAFLKETRNYLNAVADALRAFGFEPHMDRKGKPEKPVSVNESGMAGSGDVSLTMTNPDNGNNVYITIGDSALRGVVPMTDSGIAIMYRVGQNGDRYATRATNTWAPVDLSANDLAALVNSRARPVTNTEENQNARTVQSENVPAGDQGGTQGNVTTGNRDSEPLAAGVAETSESTNRGEPVSNNTQGAGGSGTRGVQPGQSTPSTSRDSGTVRTGHSTADTLSEGDTVVFSRDYEYAVTGQEYTIAKKTGAKITLSRDGAQTSLDVHLLNLALTKNLEITVTPQSKIADPATAETSPKPEIDQPADFDLANEEIGKGGLTKKYKDNIASIRILKAMQAESRLATPEERKQIARYVGWGALKGVFDKDNKQWSKEYTELKELLTDAEYKAARASTLNAHYTSPTVVGGIFKALEQVGFTSGRVLEPSVGTGNFFGLMPASMRKKSQLHGVELDPLTSQIAAALYPSAKIAQATGFQDYQVPSEYFDVAIGNPPFGSEPIVDSDRTPYSGSSIHNYFFAKSIDKLRPGGLLTMVVSHNFMDANSETTRKWISERANLVSAVRLPRTAFKENAGTDVVTDILVFQKKSDVEYRNGIGNDSWVKTGTQKLTDPKTGNEVEHRVSSYFLANPNNVLGTPSAAGSMYRAAEYTVEPNGDLNNQLSDWAESLTPNMYQPIERTHEPEAADVSVPEGVKVGSFFVGDNGSISVRGPDAMGNRTATEWTAPNAKAAERMKGMIGLRDSLREQMRLEKSPDTTTEQIEANRAELNRLYDEFNKQYGFLNDQTNRRLFLDDTESALLLALEFDYDKGVSKAVATREEIDPRNPSAVKADIFNRRVMFPPADNIKVSNAKDALLASLNYKASLDLPYMASLYDKTEAEIIDELGDVVYNDPINGYVMADEYLSGDVKTKLAEAQEAAKDNPDFKRNVEALKKVIPTDKLPSEIHAALGASFIPAELFEQFAKEVTGADHRVAYVKATGQWVIDPRGQTNDSLNVGKWGIAKMPATAIFARTMAGQGVVVTETVRLGGGKTETRVLEKETEAAREKQAALKAEWQRWLWSDPDRADRVASIYNDKMNRIVVRKYDGDHMTFPGMSPAIQLLEHQKNAVWRALQSRQVLLDHTVGAGKTFEIVALFMEMRRLGIARKPFIAVPNHLTLQWRSEFSRLYPAANVLAATPEDFSKGNREKFFSKIVTGDWDAVIVGHSSLKKISLPPETEKAVLEEQINEIADAIDQMKRERGDRNIIRDMEGIRARLAARMTQRIQALGDRDKVVTFDELGVDAFAIDELHEFKNLFYNSTMERVPGMGNPAGSDKAFDLFVKLQWMFNTFGDKAPIAGATGTPVSNSLVEMFNMQRLLQYPTLKKDGLHVFDAWAKQFGSVESLYEVAPSGTGYRQSSRFAKFKNLPALMSHYQTFADTVTLDDLKAQEEAQGKAFPVPKVFGGRPQNIVAKRSPNVASFMGTPELDIQDGHVQFGFNVAAGDRFEVKKSEQGDHLNVIIVQEIDGAEVTQHLGTAKTEEDARLMLVEQALSPKIHVDPKSILGQFSNLKELNKKTKGKVNALSLTGQANKAGLDYRLVDPTAPDFAGSKINMAVDRMMTTYHKWSADKGTQLIFCDLSVPKSARSGFGSKERRVYVRDEKGGIVHKKGTLHTAEGFEDLPHLVIKEGKEFAIYDAATGLRIRGQLPSKAVALEWTKQTLSDEAKRQRWIDARDDVGDLDQDAIDDYNNANEINTEETEAISLSDIAGASGAAGFSVYDDIKAKLIAKGVPEREIAFIHDYSTPVAKDKLFKAVNSGAIRFLLGSTPKMGAGTNVQKRLVGLHHIDAPWRPSDLEQREGRIIRRGNTLYERDPSGFEIEIYRYATEQTYDTRRWQILEHKSRGIEQLRNYDGSVNEIDDIEGEAANAADMKAAASGDPLILEETQLRNDVRRLESLQAAHADSTQMLFRRARDNQRFADEVGPRALEELQDLQATADKNPVKKDQFAGLTMNGRKIADREDAVKAIQKEMVRVFAGGSDASFTYRGIEFTLDNTLGYVELNSPTGRLDSFDPSKDSLPSAAGFLTRFANYIARIPAHIDDLNAKIAEAQRDAVELREQANSTFAQADELTAAREAHKRVQRRLIAKGPDIPAKQKTLLDKAMEAQKSALRDQGLGDAMDEFVGSRQNSRGQAISTGTTVTEVREALVNRFGEKTIARLEKDGTLSIIDVLNEPGVEGFTAGGKVTLVADALTTETIVPVFLHELGGHVGFQGVMKPQAQKNLMDQFNKLVAAKDPIALEAKRLAEREADAAAQQAEYLPYLVTVAARTQNKRPGIRNLIARIVSAVKAWAVDRLGMNISLNANDVLALAERMVSRVSQNSGNATAQFSRADNYTGMSTSEFSDQITAEYDGLKLGLHGEKNIVTLSRIVIPEVARNAGTGTAIMQRIIDWADQNGKTIALTPSSDFGGNKKRLTEFYKRFDFVENKGRNKDFEISEAMYREAGSSSAPDIRFSRADDDLGTVSQAEYDSKLNQWWKEAKQLPSDALTNSMRGWGLGLVPLRPMLKEIAKDIPAAQTYLRVKDKMDALRNEWHAKVDAVAQDWLKYRIKNREENRELMDIMHESTLEQVDPSMPFQSLMTPKEIISLKNPSMNANLRAELTAKMDLDAKREEAYDKLKIRYDDLSPEARSIFEKVRDAYSDMADAFDKTLLDNMEKAINVRIRKAEREYKREMERIKDEGMEGTERDNAVADAERALKNAKTKIAWNRKARLTQLRQQFETQRLAGPYFPLARFGQLFVTVRDAKTGEIVSFSRFEKAQEQRRFADEMKQDKNHKVEVGALADAEATRKAVDPNFVADVEDILADLPNAEQIKDEVWQRYLESLPDMSIRKSRIHRKGRAGYISDAVRAFGHHLFHGSHQLARMTYSMDLEDALDQSRDESRETKDPTRSALVVNEMNKRHQFIMNPTGGQLATWASSFAFVWYLAGSPKAALMNLFQTPIMGIPILAAYDGQNVNSIVRAGNQLTRALVDFTQGKGYAMRSSRLTAEELDAMEKGYETGIIEKTQGHELAGVAENGVEYNAMRERVMKVISWGFHHTERLNREVTFLAAYRIARNKGVPHEQAISDAGDLTWKAHFDYSNTSRPRLMHSDTMKILLVFRNFQLNMLFRLFRDVHQAMHGDSKEARREALTQLAGITGMMMLNAGITGTWLFGIAMLMAGLFLGDGEDPEEELKKGMVNILGPNLAGLALYGVPGHVTGTALSESVGMPDLWFRSPDSEKEGEEAMNFWVSQLLGAVPAIATQMFRGVSYIKKGEEYRGIETMLPKMLKDPMKSYRYATEGAKNMKGDTVAEVRWPDVVKQATGFTPARISEQYKINNLNYNKQQLILKSRKQLMDDYYKATQADDEKAVDEVISKIEKHNEKNPDQPITAKGLIQSAKTRQKGSETAVGGMRYNNKLRERILDDQAPSIYK